MCGINLRHILSDVKSLAKRWLGGKKSPKGWKPGDLIVPAEFPDIGYTPERYAAAHPDRSYQAAWGPYDEANPVTWYHHNQRADRDIYLPDIRL